ncbi:5-oxoprolinase subunit PxpB [Neobacillus drentensis]|uniref:5-oxoprolinase subunit PxpB n=1 Tax=Neobacillus drentensis TaxID=220684 RepID=UPI002FFEA7C2
MDIQPLGDAAILISFGEGINKTIYQRVQHFTSMLQLAHIPGIIEWVPAYHSVAIYYRPEIISYKKLVETVERMDYDSQSVESFQPIVYEIPVYYGGESGQDLPYIAQYHKISEEKVISLHSDKEYLIYMVGFVPGFPYLGGLAPQLEIPRLEHPRPRVPAGSVGIGGDQTGIYPSEVPSGWRIIGRTPIKLFEVDNPSPFLFSAGNYIKFFPIDWHEYLRIKNLVDEKEYSITKYVKEEE